MILFAGARLRLFFVPEKKENGRKKGVMRGRDETHGFDDGDFLVKSEESRRLAHVCIVKNLFKDEPA
jgi:hypothetical protein